jgi:threonylcarbamoyladenosine tRNA methylthiotransferase MtaB
MSSPYKTVSVYTLGCKVNFTETSTIAREFQKEGLSLVSIDEFADIYVINTCSVTENANTKCDKLVKKIKVTNPDGYIVITGCYAQLKSKELSKNKNIDLVVGSDDKINIPDIVKNKIENSIITSKVEDISSFKLSYSTGDRVRSFIKVQDGCDYNCSFCTIPLARGRSRSSRISEIIKLTNSLEKQGFKEIVLSGINLGDFGNENDESCYQLLKELGDSTKIPRIRISSIEPNLLTDKIVDLLSSSKRFMPHLHIPLQSGSDRILKLMKRRYTRNFYYNKIKKIKNKIPNISIGVDVIVGFPTETDDDFNQTYKLLSELEVAYLHVFMYSERENTMGIDIEPKVPQDTRNKRSKKLRELSDYLKSKFIIKNMDRSHTILIEGIDAQESHGYTENYIKVKVDNNNISINELVHVKPIMIMESSKHIKGQRI